MRRYFRDEVMPDYRKSEHLTSDKAHSCARAYGSISTDA